MKSVVLVSVITALAHFFPIILQPNIHRHKSKVMGLMYYIKSLSQKHLSGHMLKAEAENVKRRLPLKPHFDFLLQMPFNSLYCIFFFPWKSSPPQLLQRTELTEWVAIQYFPNFQYYPNFKHSKMPYLLHTIQTHHWIQNSDFFMVFLCVAILP